MDDIPELRRIVASSNGKAGVKYTSVNSLSFLGSSAEEVSDNLARKIIPDPRQKQARSDRKQIFDYISDFWRRSVFDIPYLADTGKGLNLAKRPFLAPSGKNNGDFGFSEQYRWDTFFQNRGMILAGGYDIAINQLLNIADVFSEYRRVPNALTTWFLSHSQPPLESYALRDLLSSGVKPGAWSQRVVRMVEEELVTEWWDHQNGRQLPRQTDELVREYGLLTRYNSIHFHPLLDGCEDGKDHNWITATYGSEYLPVQLNAIIFGLLGILGDYFSQDYLGSDQKRAVMYINLQKKMFSDFQKVFWVDEGKWRGFRNYSVGKDRGPVLYGDLAAEIWPLFSGVATREQAEVTKNNLAVWYAGDYGLAATSSGLREGGSVRGEPAGYPSFQWEYPNCWPPLMTVAVEGLKKYGYVREALEYEKKWVLFVEREFLRIGGFSEKQPYAAHVKVENGYYGIMKGFGWTIAAYLSFLHDLAVSGNL